MTSLFIALIENSINIKCFLDIGSLYGYSSLIAASIFNNCEFHCFEPNPKSIKFLKRNFLANEELFSQRNNKACFHNVIATGSKVVRQRKVHIEGFKMIFDPQQDIKNNKNIHLIDEWSIDNICSAWSLSPDFVKMDTEGFQSQILPGFYSTIAKLKPILAIEFDSPGSANDFGVSNKEVVTPLLDMGYSRLIWGHHRENNERFSICEIDRLDFKQECNSLAILIPDPII